MSHDTDWRPISTAQADGTRCFLRFRDSLGAYEPDFECFLHDDGYWYRIDPPTRIAAKPSHWRAA